MPLNDYVIAKSAHLKSLGIEEYVSDQAIYVDESKMCASNILTTNVRDRQGDIVEIFGVETANHELNPIVLVDHGLKHDLPIGKTCSPEGLYTVIKSPDEITQTTYFSQHNECAEQVFRLIADKMLSGCSMGFRPVEVARLPVDIENGHVQGKYIKRCELLEVSWVALPANQECVTALLSRGTIGGKSIAPAVKSYLMPFCLPQKEWANGIDIGMQKEEKGYFIADTKADVPPPPAHYQRYESGAVARQAGEPWEAYQSRLARIHQAGGGSPNDKLAISNRTRKPQKESLTTGEHGDIHETKPAMAKPSLGGPLVKPKPHDALDDYGKDKGLDRSPYPKDAVRHVSDVADPEVREQFVNGRERAYERRDRQSSDERYHGEGYEEKQVSSVDQSQGGALVKPKKPKQEITSTLVRHPEPQPGERSWEKPNPHHADYHETLKQPVHERLAKIRENDESAVAMDRPTYSDQVLHGVAGWHDTQAKLREHTPDVTVHERPTEETAHAAQMERQRAALPHAMRDAGEQVRRRTSEVFQGLHNDNRGTLTHDEFVRAHDEGHFNRQNIQASREARETERQAARRPEGWTSTEGGTVKEDKDYDEDLRDANDAQRFSNEWGQTPRVKPPVQRPDLDNLSDSEMAELRSRGSHHSENESEEAIPERHPGYYPGSADATQAPAETPKQPAGGETRVTNKQDKDMDTEEMKDMPGAAALRKLHGHLGEMHGAYCSAMKEIEQPKVRALLEKLTGHMQDHIDRVGDLFGSVYGDHKPLHSKKDNSAREGVPAQNEQYEAKDISESDLQDYDKNPQTTDSRHPEGWQVADGGARDHSGRFPQRTESNPHPQGWQQAHGGPDNGEMSEHLHEIRDPRGHFRRPAALDKSYDAQQMIRAIVRKAKFLGLID